AGPPATASASRSGTQLSVQGRSRRHRTEAWNIGQQSPLTTTPLEPAAQTAKTSGAPAAMRAARSTEGLFRRASARALPRVLPSTTTKGTPLKQPRRQGNGGSPGNRSGKGTAKQVPPCRRGNFRTRNGASPRGAAPADPGRNHG